MRFYQRLSPIKAISFDLDDTLYSNAEIMQATTEKMHGYFSQSLADVANKESFDENFWYEFRVKALIHTPELSHDVGELRRQSYFLGLKSLGFSTNVAMEKAQHALHYFIEQRSDFSVPKPIHQFLSQLKEHWPLIAISNGNVDTDRIGLSSYFEAIYQAGNGIKQKPHGDMFYRTCQQFDLQPKQLLHVGDCGENDIFGAMRFGCQTAWVSAYTVGKPLQTLPHIELTDVTDLLRLI